MSTNCQACVEHQNALLSPWSEEARVAGRWFEGWIVIGYRDIDVFEGRGSWGRRSHREAETVCLIVVMIWVLPKNYGADRRQRRVTGPIEKIDL
jgi:hypothetical protein